jgi:hypothetical protein
MSISPLPSRVSSTEYSEFKIDDAQVALVTAFALRDQPGLVGLIESTTPEDDESSEYSVDDEDPFDIPVAEWETMFPDKGKRYESLEDALDVEPYVNGVLVAIEGT